MTYLWECMITSPPVHFSHQKCPHRRGPIQTEATQLWKVGITSYLHTTSSINHPSLFLTLLQGKKQLYLLCLSSIFYPNLLLPQCISSDPHCCSQLLFMALCQANLIPDPCSKCSCWTAGLDLFLLDCVSQCVLSRPLHSSQYNLLTAPMPRLVMMALVHSQAFPVATSSLWIGLPREVS